MVLLSQAQLLVNLAWVSVSELDLQLVPLTTVLLRLVQPSLKQPVQRRKTVLLRLVQLSVKQPAQRKKTVLLRLVQLSVNLASASDSG